jgi:hypothetical protein
MSNLAIQDEFVTINDERHLLKVKVKHLAAEAGIIRKEEAKHSGMKKWGMQHHRKTTLRDAARQTQLAYAIIRGKTLESTMGKYGSKLPPIQKWHDIQAVAKMVGKYGDPDIKYVVETWFK